eukprot:848785-Pyramimonas_sp.AAC.1
MVDPSYQSVLLSHVKCPPWARTRFCEGKLWARNCAVTPRLQQLAKPLKQGREEGGKRQGGGKKMQHERN